MSDSRTPRPNQFQPKHPYTYMPSRMNLHSTSTSTIVLWLTSSTIWLKPLVQTSWTLPIRLPSTHPIQGHHMAMRFSIWFAIWRRLANWVCISSLIPARVLNAIVMLTFWDCGTRPWHQWTPVLPNHEAVGLSSMQDVLSPGPPNSNPKLHFPPLRLNILQCHRLSGMSFLSWDFYRKWGSKISRSSATSPMCIARFLKTIPVHLNWQDFPNFVPGPSISTCAIIIFVNMSEKASSRSSQSTLKTRLLMLSPKHWHKMIFNIIVASCAARDLTSNQSEGVLGIQYFGTYFRVETFSCFLLGVTILPCLFFDIINHVWSNSACLFDFITIYVLSVKTPFSSLR